MRVLSAFFALVLVVVMMTQMIFVSAKDLCNPITISGKTVDPSVISPAFFSNMTNRGSGSNFYYFEANICNTIASSPQYVKRCLLRYGNPKYCPITPGTCGGPHYVSIWNYQNATCLGAFDKPLMRPTPTKDGFKVAYTSSTQPKDQFELAVLCNPFGVNDTLSSRSYKFAVLNPNKNGGSTYMAVLFTHAVCPGGSHHHHHTREPIPTGDHHHSEEPSSGLPPIPSGGSGSGSSSGMPPIPSGGGSDSGMPPIPSGGAAGSESGVASQDVDDHKNSGFPSEVAHHEHQHSGFPSEIAGHHEHQHSGHPSELAHHEHQHSGHPSEMAGHHEHQHSGHPSEVAHHEQHSGFPSEMAGHHEEHSGFPPIPSGNQ